ncbi:MAG: hypothetical protein AAGJ54_01155 [Planctomycetota bacterium]
MITTKHIDELERILSDLAAEHRQLVGLAHRHRQALRDADGAEITRIALQRDGINGRLVELNEARLSVTAHIAGALGQQASEVTVRSVISMLEGPRSASLGAIADDLKRSIVESRREHSILRGATAAFAGHLGGVLHRAVELCAPARTYTAAGRVAIGSSVPSALDVRH